MRLLEVVVHPLLVDELARLCVAAREHEKAVARRRVVVERAHEPRAIGVTPGAMQTLAVDPVASDLQNFQSTLHIASIYLAVGLRVVVGRFAVLDAVDELALIPVLVRVDVRALAVSLVVLELTRVFAAVRKCQHAIAFFSIFDVIALVFATGSERVNAFAVSFSVQITAFVTVTIGKLSCCNAVFCNVFVFLFIALKHHLVLLQTNKMLTTEYVSVKTWSSSPCSLS